MFVIVFIKIIIYTVVPNIPFSRGSDSPVEYGVRAGVNYYVKFKSGI